MVDDAGHDHASSGGPGHEPAQRRGTTHDAAPSGSGSASSGDRRWPEAVVRGYWNRIWLQCDLDALADLTAGKIVRHTSAGSEVLSRGELRRRLASAFEALRICEVSFDAVTAVGATVWLRLTLRGISLPTATPMTLTWIAQYRIEAGRIAEIWSLHEIGVDWSP